MNKLLISEGGQPLYLDDLDFMQNAFAESMKGLISTYGNVILSGCEIQLPISIAGKPTTYRWEKGYMAIGGEVYLVEEGSFSGAMNASLYWKVVSTEGQNEVFENSSEHNVYQYRKVVLTDTVEAADVYVSVHGMKTVDELTSKIRTLEIEEVTVDSVNQRGTIKLYDDDIPLIEDGDIVELLVSVGMEDGSVMGGYTPNLESFKYLTTGMSSAAKAIVWIKTNNVYEVVVIYINFIRQKGSFNIVNCSSGKLRLSPKSSHRVIIYKNLKK